MDTYKNMLPLQDGYYWTTFTRPSGRSLTTIAYVQNPRSLPVEKDPLGQRGGIRLVDDGTFVEYCDGRWIWPPDISPVEHTVTFKGPIPVPDDL